jgi:hypothetical protein
MRLLLPVVLLIASPTALAWGDCAHRAERRVELDAAGIRQLVLQARAGDLDVRGEPGRTRIEAVGEACADSAERLEAIQLASRRDGDRVQLTAVMPDDGGWGWSSYASLSLTVRVPEVLAVQAADSSGDARFESFASLEVEDSSGDLVIEGIGGAVTLSDSSGDVDVRRCAGPVTVRRDSSGDVEIADVAGDVVVDTDSSGDIDVRQVRGAARVGSDSSGDIEFADIGGDVEVGADGSGSIRADRVGGNFSVRRDGSGSIDHSGVSGAVSIPPE